jgi:hypothetical protein
MSAGDPLPRLYRELASMRILRAAGFEPRVVPFVHSQVEPGTCETFVGMKPAD